MHKGGTIFPLETGLIFEHIDFAGAPLKVKLMSLTSTPSHGTALLHVKLTATSVPEAPVIFL